MSLPAALARIRVQLAFKHSENENAYARSHIWLLKEFLQIRQNGADFIASK